MSASNRLLHFLILPASILVISYSPANTPISEPSPAILPTPTPTIVPTKTLNPINSTDLTNLSINCVEVLDMVPTNIKLRNSLVLSSPSSENYILDLETNEKANLEGSLSDELIVSPDMQKIAYIDFDTEKPVIYDVNNNGATKYDGFDGRFRLAKWLDNENLIINRAKEDKPLYYHYSLVIFDSQTSIFKEFNLDDFPKANIYSTGYPYLYPNPQITKMIYLARDDESIVLFDMESESQLIEIYFSEGIPAWTKDGEEFAISAVLNFDKYSNFADDLPYWGGGEIFLVNAMGGISRLTFLATQYPNNYFSFLSWSPTEEYVAFDLQNITQPNFGLSILNISTGEIVNYCIQDNWDYIYWSPDGKQIAFTRGNGFESYKSAYILDLEKNLAFKIADDATVAGWVTNQ